MAENLTTVGELRNRLADFSDTAQVSVRVGDQFYLIDGVNDRTMFDSVSVRPLFSPRPTGV